MYTKEGKEKTATKTLPPGKIFIDFKILSHDDLRFRSS